MTKLFTKISVKERRRTLRHNMTRAEAILWNRLKQKQICGQRFLRQFSIDSFILDFFCSKLYLAIEVDGDTHLTKDEILNDINRQHKIESHNIHFLRFTNGEIYSNLDQVIETIRSKVNDLIKNPPTPL
jgi:very-short-patch-repair endonuclease